LVYKIIQWGTGNVGTHALRIIAERPDFELAGVRVYSADKVGVDAGNLLGGAPLGVLATDDTDAIIGLDADCVCYSPLGSTLDGGGAVDDIARLLASGKNVVSSALEQLAYLGPDINLPGAGPDVYERLTQACRDGGTSFFHAGINPGFAMDLWPMQLSRLCGRIDTVRVSEVVDMSRYTSIHMVRDAIGFGLPAEAETPLDAHFRQIENSPFYLSMRMLADAMGVQLDEVKYHREVVPTDRDVTIAAGTIEAGTIAAMKMCLDGWVGGRPAIAYELIWRVTDHVATDWPQGDSRWLLHIDGDMTVDSEVALKTTLGAGRAVSLAVATLLLNSVPTVCSAESGLIDNLSLAPHACGFLSP
jgi:2,4-diaminopentanoate dehydrogenase